MTAKKTPGSEVCDSPTVLSLSALTAAVNETPVTLRTIDLDISAFIPGAPVLTLAELSTPQLYLVPTDGGLIRRKNPDWPVGLAYTVASLALAHVAPAEAGQSAALLYIGIARNNRRLFSHIAMTYTKAFPESVAPGVEDEDEAKND